METNVFERNGHLLEKKFKEYFIPTTLSGMSMMIAAIIDGIIVGQTIGANAMAAVNVASPIILLFQALFVLLGAGGATLVSVSKGARNKENANAAFTLSFFGMLLASVLLMVVGIFFIDELTGLICNDDTLFTFTRNYVRVLLLGSPFMVLIPGMVYLIRADGQPKYSAQILLVANGVNLSMDLVYILLLGMNIGGAALATITGYAVGVVWVARYWFSKKRTLHLVPIHKRHFALLKDVFGYGLTGTVNTLLLSFKMLFVNRVVLLVGGANAMAVYAVCNSTISFISMFVTGSSDTMVPILGMLYGERDTRGMRFVFQRAMRVVIVGCIASILLLEVFPKAILTLFNVVDPAAVSMGLVGLRIFAISLLGAGVSFTLMYYLQTLKHRNIAIFISSLRGLFLIVPLVTLLAMSFGIVGVWWGFVLAEAITLLLAFILCHIVYHRKKNRYTSWLLEEKPSENEVVYDVSIKGSANDAVALSEGLISFGKEQNLTESQANLLGLLAEDAAVNIMAYNQTQKDIELDILCRIDKENIILSLRDDGEALDMFSVQEEDAFALDNITVMKRVAKKVEYAHTLGLNTTVLTLERNS